MFRRSEELDASVYFVHIELGNLLLKRGEREEALQEYSAALKCAPEDKLIRKPIEGQIKRFTEHPNGTIPPLRNPYME